jgi:hypothetical protein
MAAIGHGVQHARARGAREKKTHIGPTTFCKISKQKPVFWGGVFEIPMPRNAEKCDKQCLKVFVVFLKRPKTQ